MTDLLEPADETALAEALLEAGAAGAPLRVEGGATRIQAGTGPSAARRLTARRLSGIVAYEPGTLTLVARAGTPLGAIEAALAAEGQALAFEPMDHRALLSTTGEPTIGGVVAANVSGPRRVLVGACRDHLLGVRFIDGRGRRIANGGRVMKNVTGLDLGKLLCGSFGTLGILTEVALRTSPRPETGQTLAFPGLTAEAAVRLFCTALGTPFEVSGAAWVGGAACLRIEGFAAQVAYRVERLKDRLRPAETALVTGPEHEALWRDIRDVTHFAGRPSALWRISVKPTDAPRVAAALEARLGADISLDWGGGLIWADLPGREDAAPDAVRDIVRAIGGHSTCVRQSQAGRAQVFEPEAPRAAALSRALRRSFDPANVLNPGMMAD